MESPEQPALDEIFHGALERQGPDRAGFLRAACAGDEDLRQRVEALLASHEGMDSFLEEPLVEGRRTAAGEPGPGSRIGPYKLLQEIGEGGMGVVYMAEQEEPVRRKVALKVIKLGMDTKQVIARFEAERQALALMEHPNIARVLDAGATDSGRPFFVMELVRGVPIHEYCDKHQLSTEQRMSLFVDTCRAVHHAHQKGIIHRDIKPGNVLVTSHDGTPVVKIIDFGVAKATNQRLTERTLFTEFRQVIGTPEYLSPEQAEMSGLDVDTRTDIYALGVLLYLLLTGSTPFDPAALRAAGYGEMTRMIREDEPLSPSTRVSRLGAGLDELARQRDSEPRALMKLMRGEVDWIVMRAMAKDRNRRYDSAAALADDVARHLRNEPVLAGPPSNLYRVRKLVQRNRALVLATALGAAAVLVGLGLALSGYHTARQEAERSSRISSTLTEMLALAGNAESLDLDVRALLATARDVFGDDHATVAATLAALAGQLRDAGDLRGAIELYDEAARIYRSAYGDEHRTVAAALANLGTLQSQIGQSDRAIESLRESLRIEALQPTRAGGTGARRELARLLGVRGEYGAADELLRQSLERIDSSDSARHNERMDVIDERIQIAFANPRHGDLDPLYRDLVDAAEKAFSTGHLVPAIARFGHGMYLARAGRAKEAEPVLWAALNDFDAQESPPAAYLFTTLDMLFQILRNETAPARRDLADEVLMRFLEEAPDSWTTDEAILASTYEFAVSRFYRNGRLSFALRLAGKLFGLATRLEGEAMQVKVALQMCELVLKIAAQKESSTADLERGLGLLALFPEEGALGVRVRVLRALLRRRLGEDVDLSAVLEQARAGIDPDDDTTLEFLTEVKNTVGRFR